MENKFKALSCILLTINFLFSHCTQISGQEKINLSLGLGFPELLNVGIRYQLEQKQLGIGIGYMPVMSVGFETTDNKMISVSSDFYYHFGGFSEFSKRRPWYLRSGIIYCNAAGGNDLLWLNLRSGRDINLSMKYGLSIDAGIILELFNEERRSDPQLYSDLPSYLLPGIGLCIFYRVNKH